MAQLVEGRCLSQDKSYRVKQTSDNGKDDGDETLDDEEPLPTANTTDTLHTLTGLIVTGTAPGQPMLYSSRLTALLKPDGGYRPIAVGELIYRLCTKAILRHIFRPDFLLAFQFGVGTKGGVEPVIRAAQRALDNSLGRSFTHLTSLLQQRIQHGGAKRNCIGTAPLLSQPLPGGQMGLRVAVQPHSDKLRDRGHLHCLRVPGSASG
jgi:hypothetical protein